MNHIKDNTICHCIKLFLCSVGKKEAFTFLLWYWFIFFLWGSYKILITFLFLSHSKNCKYLHNWVTKIFESSAIEEHLRKYGYTNSCRTKSVDRPPLLAFVAIRSFIIYNSNYVTLCVKTS